MNNLIYKFTYIVMSIFFFIFYPKEIIGKENIPNENCVICANHSNAIDPFLLATSLSKNRPMSFLCKKEAFENRIVSWYLTSLHCIPIDRGNNDIKAIKSAFKCIKEGRSLVIFPEGTRVKHPFQERAKGGANLIASRMHVVILPCFIENEKKIFKKTRIIFGKPIDYSQHIGHWNMDEYQKCADELLETIYELGLGKKT